MTPQFTNMLYNDIKTWTVPRNCAFRQLAIKPNTPTHMNLHV